MPFDQKIKIGKRVIYIPDAFDVMISRQEDSNTQHFFQRKTTSPKQKEIPKNKSFV